MKRYLLCLTLLTFLGSARAADYDAAKKAYDARDWRTARQEFKPLAEAGDAKAQFYLGVMYSHALGVQRDYAAAVKWYRLAADQGYGKAQCNLGTLYGEGKGVARDRVEAHKWFYLASQSDQKDAQENGKFNLSENARFLSKEQTDQAIAMAKKWKPKK